MELYELIDLLQSVDNEADKLRDKDICIANVTVKRNDDWWTLIVRHKVMAENDKDSYFSDYTRDFENIHDLVDHIRTLCIGLAFAKWEEV